MIAGRQIADELSKLIGTGGYDPNGQPGSRKLPQTMRQLLEADFDVEGSQFDIGIIRPRIDLQAGLARRNSAGLIQSKQLNIRRPEPPAIGGEDYRGYYSLLSSFWKWLKKKRKAGKINIDHHLKDQPWPLMERFESEIYERTGCYINDFFPQPEWECSDEEPQDWSAAWMPLYNLEMEEDASPLIEFLCAVPAGCEDQRLPEAAYQDRDASMVDRAGEILFGIIKHRRFRLLPDEWANAIRALIKYGSGLIAYVEPDETKVDILCEKDIEYFFKCGKDVADMIEGTLPLVRKCRENSEKFWDDLIEHLLDLPVYRKPKTKTLIQVFNERQKIKVRA